MTLFRAESFWQSPVEHNEEYDVGCLCVANIDNENPPSDKIITGSFGGVLRIYHPRGREFTADDLLLEHKFSAPALQIGHGKFFSGTAQIGLVILHPREISVYEVQSVIADVSQGNYVKLFKRHTHNLTSTAMNMTIGAFGGVYNRSLICVQSIDGKLTFIDRETMLFERYLPNFVIPGPIAYQSSIDSIIVANSQLGIDCYKFRALSDTNTTSDNSAGKKNVSPLLSPTPTQTQTPQKKPLTSTWTLCLGETPRQILVARFSRSLTQTQSDIVVITDQSIYCIKETGDIRMEKRIEFLPNVATSYPLRTKDDLLFHNLLVSSSTGNLVVFRDTQIVWVAKAEHKHVDISTITVGDLRGLIVTLSEQGHVDIQYLGTSPSSVLTTPSESKEIDYFATEEELKRLESEIKEMANLVLSEPPDGLNVIINTPTNVSVDTKMKTRPSCQMSFTVTYIVSQDEQWVEVSSLSPKVIDRKSRSLSLEGKSPQTKRPLRAANIEINVILPKPFKADNKNFFISELRPSQSMTFTLTVENTLKYPPVSLNGSLVIVYLSQSEDDCEQPLSKEYSQCGESRIHRVGMNIPFSLAAQHTIANRNAIHKIVIDTNLSTPIPISTIFKDIIDTRTEKIEDSGHVFTMQFFGDKDASIVSAKSSGRYRLQSDEFSLLAILLSELTRRLKAYTRNREDLLFWQSEADSKNKPSKRTVAVEDSSKQNAQTQAEQIKFRHTENTFPLIGYQSMLDSHHSVRVSLKECKQSLTQSAAQHRAVQKRLIAKYKDRNTVSLNGFDRLMTLTTARILSFSKEAKALTKSLQREQIRLSASTRLMQKLLKYHYNLDSTNSEMLRCFFSEIIDDNEDIGWEERTEDSLWRLRQTMAQNSTRRESTHFTTQANGLATSTKKVKEGIKNMIERFESGQRLSLQRKGTEQKKALGLQRKSDK